MKRLIDITVSVAAMILLSPLFLIIMLLVRVQLGSPVLFSQLRPGLYKKPFRMYKFRTMLDRRDKYGNMLPDAQRLTKFGKLLRNLSLDELPEFFNVIKGEMSLVGPRPLLMEYLLLYDPVQVRRHEVKPGITGWAQVNGRNAITWEEKFRMDVWYVDNRSFWLDCKILWLTLVMVFRRQGITQEGHATMEKFKGNKQNI